MKSIITGVTGFVGSHLTDLLLAKGHKLNGIARGSGGDENITHLKRRVTLFNVDILNKKRVIETVKKVKPDYIFHFAAQSSNLDSIQRPEFTFKTNVIGTLNLLDGVVAAKIKPSIVFAGSSEEYGLVEKDELPISENNPLRPRNPYAVSKIAASYLCYQYAKTYGLKIIRVRSFNQEGPRRQERYALSNFAKQIAEIERGMKEPVISVGNLDAERDFLDVRDAVSAYWMVAQRGEGGDVYNVCSMKPRKIKDVLDILLSLSLTKGIKIRIDRKRMRPSDLPVFYGNNTKIMIKTGWSPKIVFEQTLDDTLNYWREKIR